MIASLQRFGAALRRGGIPVTVSALESAAKAAAAIELDNRESLRSALKTTLIRHHHQTELFDMLFDAVFSLRDDSGSAFTAALSARLGQERAESVARLVASVSPLAAATAGETAGDLDSMIALAGGSLDTGGAQSKLQVGAVSYRLGSAIGLETTEADVDRRLKSELSSDEAAIASEVFRERISAIRDAIRERVADEISVAAPRHHQKLSLDALASRGLAGLSPSEQALLTAEVGRLAKTLLRARKRQRSHPSMGRIDISRTLRTSLATGGVPMRPRFEKRARRKPRIVILCDVSDSVKNVSRFMLQLVYLMARATGGVRSFVFVADLGETTDLFRQAPIESAVELALGGEVINVLANSNYGRSLEQFAERHLGAVSSRTTVIIIGDGRSNYHDPGLDALAKIRRVASRVLWLTPEPSSLWGFGDSAMRQYQTMCDEVAVVSSLQSLREVARELL